MLATIGGGALMFAVHPLARAVGKAEYGIFGTLLAVVMLALAMIPLALANVLVNNLLARAQFRVVAFVFLLAAAYAATMIHVNHVAHSLVVVPQVMGAFNFLLLGLCAWFSWRDRAHSQAAFIES